MEAFSWFALIGHNVDYKSKIYRLIHRDLEIVIVGASLSASSIIADTSDAIQFLRRLQQRITF